MTRRFFGVLAALVTLVALAGPAAASDPITIRSVDTGDYPTIKLNVQVGGQKPDLGAFNVRENGKLVGGVKVLPIGQTQVPVGIVLVVDTSGSMNKNGAIDQAKAAAKQFVAQKQPNDQVALVAFADRVSTVLGFTTDANQLNAAIDGLAAKGETALWDGVRQGVGLFTDRRELLPNVVVLSDGKDTVSQTTADEAKGSANAARAVVYSVGLKGGDFEAGPISDLANSTGGQYLETTDPKALSAAYATVQQAIQNQYEVSYTTAATGNIDIDVAVGNLTASVKAIPTNVRGVVSKPEIVDSKSIPGPLKSSWAPILIAALSVLAAGLLAYAILLMFSKDRTVERALQPYAEAGPAASDEADEFTLAESPLVQRAVAATARIAKERGILDRVEGALERADLPIQASEALFFYLAGVAVLSALAGVAGGLFPFVVVALLTILFPPAILAFLAGRRKRKFTSQLPDTLTLLAGTLRAGYSLLQGVEAVAQEIDDPMGRELRRVLAEARLGRPLEDALEDAAARMESADFEWAVMAIRIQREVGGNLAELLDTVAETMIQRERLRREVRALTAEGRISAIVLGIMPVALGFMMYALNPDYMRPLFRDSLGQALLIGSGLLALVGFYWMKKTIEIEV